VRFRARLLVLLLAAALVSAGAAPRATAVDAEALGGTDVGARLARLGATLRAAEADALVESSRRDRIAADLTVARERRVLAETRLAALDQAAEQARLDLEAARRRVVEVVRSTYVDGGHGGDLIAGILDAKSAIELSRRQELARRVGDGQHRAALEFRRARVRAKRAADDARVARDEADREVAQLERELPAAAETAARAEQVAARARFQYDRWASVQAGPGTPIMGVARLTGTELARWFVAERRSARTTVPIEELARIYIEEGDAAGVRGDIAFAQSVLETGSFFFPDRGQVRSTDNNFAGIGACDSCSTGRGYPDARTGVRAQVQLLRAYADASITATNLGHPPVDPKLPNFFLRGRAPTWSGLTGTWATSTTYAPKIFDVYFRILAWVTDHPTPSGTGLSGRE
jgi:hypothetical protein